MAFIPSDQVVVSKAEDTIIYVVRSIAGSVAELVYYQGENKVSGGDMDVSVLMEPTDKQMENGNGLRVVEEVEEDEDTDHSYASLNYSDSQL